MYDHEVIDFIGFAAATLTTVSFVPQLLKTLRTRSAGDLSLGTLVALCAGILLWLIFGVATHAAPVIAANAATLPLVGMQLCLTLYYRRRNTS